MAYHFPDYLMTAREMADQAREDYQRKEQERKEKEEAAAIAAGDAYKCPHCGAIRRWGKFRQIDPDQNICYDCAAHIPNDKMQHVKPEDPKEKAVKRGAAVLAMARGDLLSRKSRSAWDRGVNLYALDLLDDLTDAITGGWFDPDDLAAPLLVRRELLNGAHDWHEYSWGGCSLIYDGDVAERLCTPSVLKKTRGGERRPNCREEWLDVQARALRQAARRVEAAVAVAVMAWEVANNG